MFRAWLALSALAEITRRYLAAEALWRLTELFALLNVSAATLEEALDYHFLDMQTGRRVWRSELSTIDTALALAESWVAESGTLALRLPLSRTIFAKLQHF